MGPRAFFAPALTSREYLTQESFFAATRRLLSTQDYRLFTFLHELVNYATEDRAANALDYAHLFHEQSLVEIHQRLLSDLREDEEFRLKKGREKAKRSCYRRKINADVGNEPWFCDENALRPNNESEQLA
ncbi:hypothetical protein F4777DRAFT_600121 [Nemania sp. FL0916]|nr:hypothetical protein F4777DRAFT_600121 [Nemania sp. FL0916]